MAVKLSSLSVLVAVLLLNVENSVSRNQDSSRSLKPDIVAKNGDNDIRSDIESLRSGLTLLTNYVIDLSSDIKDIRKEVAEHHRGIYYLNTKLTDLAKRVNKLHPVNTTVSPTASATTTSQPTNITWVYFPPGTHDDRAQRSYPEYNATIIGFGQPAHYDRCKYKSKMSFNECLIWCHGLRELESTQYDGFTYFWDTTTRCFCNKNESGHWKYTSALHYHFN